MITILSHLTDSMPDLLDLRHPVKETNACTVMEISETFFSSFSAILNAPRHRKVLTAYRNARNKVRRITVYPYKRHKAFRSVISTNTAGIYTNISAIPALSVDCKFFGERIKSISAYHIN